MSYDNEAIVRNAYHTAEGNVLDLPDGPPASPRMACLTASPAKSHIEASILKDIVITFAKMFPDVHRELHRVNVWATWSPLSCPFKEPFAARWKRPPA